mgnify:FL=1
MQILIKITGLALVLAVSTAIGFLRAAALKTREKRLFGLYLCMCDLKERIRLENDELRDVLKKSFNGQVSETDGGFKISVNGILPEDEKLINEYFSSAGMSDPDAEYERAQLYASLVKKQHSAAAANSAQLCKLYKTIGFMAGIFICIFLI